MARKIIQIAHAISSDRRGETVVLCDDGTLWGNVSAPNLTLKHG